jgi:hypothetical protein
MITLHGIYDNGKIVLEDLYLPQIKAKAEIKIFPENIEKNKKINELHIHKSDGVLLIPDLSRESYYDNEI